MNNINSVSFCTSSSDLYDKTQLIYFCLLTEEFSWPPCTLCILCALCALVETGVTKLSLYLLAMVYINWVCQFKCQELGSALSGGGREGGTEGRRTKAHESAVQDYMFHLKRSLLVKLASTAMQTSYDPSWPPKHSILCHWWMFDQHLLK